MGWPKGVPHPRKAGSHRKALEAHPAIDPAAFDIVLTLKRLRKGQFAGLWQLARILPTGQVKIITDANSKSQALRMAIHEIQRAGVEPAHTVPIGMTD